MRIELAEEQDRAQIVRLDCHVPPAQLEACIRNGQVYVLRCGTEGNGGVPSCMRDLTVGVLRYSLFWQKIPFLDLLYVEEAYRNRGFGTEMMRAWEARMKALGYKYVMTSTQADETAWQFYEKLGYQRVGGFLPFEQDAEEWMYLKPLLGESE